ncbi:MAG: prepilin-type N-terminal cleavage/methylation domain-containing protein [Deltaproteobacteria bacterium]|nr:MAG: prepilin-type N-terminal cleavage/methylation domain-containing protein [Deltaproteobacteria bacterium]
MKNNRGLTLIELMVAMAIVGLIFAAAASGLRSVFNMGLKSDAGHLGAVIRTLSNKAITEHIYLRLVYDIDHQKYSVEQSDEPFLVTIEEDKKENLSDKLIKSQNKQKNEDEESPPPEETSDSKAEKKSEEFSTIEEGALKPANLSSGVFFKDIDTSYASTKVTDGLAYTYFFPDGFATQTMVHLRNEDDDDHYSIEVSPVSGKVKIESEYREMEKE